MRWARVRDGTLDYFGFLTEFPAIQSQTRHWLTTGLTASSSRTAETCRHLLAADPDLWQFVPVPGLEPTNNRAERALRHPVIWRRSSHGTQSDAGSRFVERMLTVVETCLSNSDLSLTSCGMRSSLTRPVSLRLRSYPLPNLKTILGLPPERIRCSCSSGCTSRGTQPARNSDRSTTRRRAPHAAPDAREPHRVECTLTGSLHDKGECRIPQNLIALRATGAGATPTSPRR